MCDFKFGTKQSVRPSREVFALLGPRSKSICSFKNLMPQFRVKTDSSLRSRNDVALFQNEAPCNAYESTSCHLLCMRLNRDRLHRKLRSSLPVTQDLPLMQRNPFTVFPSIPSRPPPVGLATD